MIFLCRVCHVGWPDDSRFETCPACHPEPTIEVDGIKTYDFTTAVTLYNQHIQFRKFYVAWDDPANREEREAAWLAWVVAEAERITKEAADVEAAR